MVVDWSINLGRMLLVGKNLRLKARLANKVSAKNYYGIIIISIYMEIRSQKLAFNIKLSTWHGFVILFLKTVNVHGT